MYSILKELHASFLISQYMIKSEINMFIVNY